MKIIPLWRWCIFHLSVDAMFTILTTLFISKEQKNFANQNIHEHYFYALSKNLGSCYDTTIRIDTKKKLKSAENWDLNLRECRVLALQVLQLQRRSLLLCRNETLQWAQSHMLCLLIDILYSQASHVQPIICLLPTHLAQTHDGWCGLVTVYNTRSIRYFHSHSYVVHSISNKWE